MRAPNPNCYSVKCDHCGILMENGDGVILHYWDGFKDEYQVSASDWMNEGDHHCCPEHWCICWDCDGVGTHKDDCSEADA